MAALAEVYLVPIKELTPGAIGKIRNDVIETTVALAERELSLSRDRLVVRDVRPVEDLQIYASHGAAATVEDWIFTTTNTTDTGFVTVTGDASMADDRFVALFGIRDKRMKIADVAAATPAEQKVGPSSVSLVKLSVGGADKVIWDTKCVQGYAYLGNLVAFCPSAVIIPQNLTFNIYYYKSDATASMIIWLELIGITVEPRGKTISP